MNLIIGGTGTLGQELTKQLIKKNQAVTVFSRDELKQKEMQHSINNKLVKFVVGDIKDRDSLNRVIRRERPTSVFHVAALKHVDILESNPEEAIKTNVIGTINVADACQEYGVKFCALSSTDKAVEPINAYGASKMLAEKVFFNRNTVCPTDTKFSVFRWGNILGSRGSAIHGFVHSITNNECVRLTHPEMTRFWLKIEDAVEFMLDGYKYAYLKNPMIPDCKSASVVEVCESIARLCGTKVNFEVVGIRPGEKIHEKLSNDMCSDTYQKYTEQELDDLLKGVI